MAIIKQKIDCTSCGERNVVTLITQQSKFSRSVKIVKCPKCKVQARVLVTLNRKAT